MPNMGAKFIPRLRLRNKEATVITNLEHYHVDFFEKVITIQLNELDKRFGKQSSALLLLLSCLNPRNSFQAFDRGNLVKYARFYPSDFSDSDIASLDLQLQAFVADVRSDVRFREMNTLSALSVKMVETDKNAMYPLVYLLLKLALILPGTPATAKTASCAMKFIHSTMTKEPCNQRLSDCLLLYLERDILENITNDGVIASL
uniref:HAT C-terminal dimerisation domain-containing protein n=1 Tax=Arundo donax TaxID=35708 RepID=A0A0A8ZS97_ARUDO